MIGLSKTLESMSMVSASMTPAPLRRSKTWSSMMVIPDSPKRFRNRQSVLGFKKVKRPWSGTLQKYGMYRFSCSCLMTFRSLSWRKRDTSDVAQDDEIVSGVDNVGFDPLGCEHVFKCLCYHGIDLWVGVSRNVVFLFLH